MSFVCGRKTEFKSICISEGCQEPIIKTNSAGVWFVVFLHYAIKLKVSAKDVIVEKAQQYRTLLSVEGNVLPDPRADLNSNCVGKRGECVCGPPKYLTYIYACIEQ